jgi:hypothetical protein
VEVHACNVMQESIITSSAFVLSIYEMVRSILEGGLVMSMLSKFCGR